MTIYTDEELNELKRKWTEQSIKETYAPPSSQKTYFLFLALMILIMVAAIVLVEVFTPETKDTTATITQIIGFGGTITAGLLAYLKSQETHKLVNSGLHEWIDAAVAKAFSAGKELGRKESDARTDSLQAQIPVNTMQLVTKIETGPLTNPLKDPPVTKKE